MVMHLDASPAVAPGPAPARRAYHRACAECGRPFEAARRHGQFCAPPCRTAFNNRRAKRGSELYDLVMALRFQRGPAKALGVWRLVCRMASHYRGEDERERAGRPSWRPLRDAIADHSWANAIRIRVRGGRGAASR